MRIPDLREDDDQIELDRITILVDYIQQTFDKVYGTAPDIEQWDAVRIKEEMSDLFTPSEFNRLFKTEFGRGVLVGAWVTEFIMKEGEVLDETN